MAILVGVVAVAATWLLARADERSPSIDVASAADDDPEPGTLDRLVLRDAPGGLVLRLYADGLPTLRAAADEEHAICEPSQQLVIEVSNRSAALQQWAAPFSPPATKPVTIVVAQPFGEAEGEPAWFALVRVHDEIELVRTADDASEPRGGYALLGGAGPLPRDADVEALADGAVVAHTRLDDTERCYAAAAVPTMPAPGDQPDDPKAADADVRGAYFDAFDHAADPADRETAVAHLSDLQDKFDRAAQSFPDAVATITVRVDEVVFTAPDRAAVRFELNYSGGAEFGIQIGAAELVEGRWLVARETMCMVLGWAGVQC